MTTAAHDIEEKKWFKTTMRLSELKAAIAELEANMIARHANMFTEDPCIVIVTKSLVGRWREVPITKTGTRTEVMNAFIEDEINRKGGNVSESKIHELEAQVEDQMSKSGDVLYLVAGTAQDFAPGDWS